MATTTAFGTIPAKYFKTHPLGRSYYKFLEKVTMGYQNFMEVEMFSFSQALAELRLGKRIARTGWNGKGMYIELQPPFAGNKMTLPYIYMKTACDNFVPWLASQTDILATDWVIV